MKSCPSIFYVAVKFKTKKNYVTNKFHSFVFADLSMMFIMVVILFPNHLRFGHHKEHNKKSSLSISPLK